jgi:hypothetical protein
LGLLKGKEIPEGRSKIELGLEANDIALNANPKIYNHIVNIHNLFDVVEYSTVV